MEYRLYNGDLVRVGGVMYNEVNQKCHIIGGDAETMVVAAPLEHREWEGQLLILEARDVAEFVNDWTAMPKAVQS